MITTDGLERRVRQAQRDAREHGGAPATETLAFNPINSAATFREVLLNLASGSFLHRFNGRAYGLVYLSEGSVPGGRLDLDFLGGGKLTNQSPGTYIPVHFEQLEIARGSRSASIGNARLLVLLDPSARYVLPAVVAPASPTVLLGSATAMSAVQGEDALPPTHSLAFDTQTVNFIEGLTVTGGTSSATGVISSQVDSGGTGILYLASVTGTFQAAETITASTGSAAATAAQVALGVGAVPTSFEVTGWKTISVMIDTQTASGNATSFDLVPHFYDSGVGAWSDQSIGKISVPDSTTTGQRYRYVTIDVTGLTGWLYLQISALLAAARTGLAFKVTGVN